MGLSVAEFRVLIDIEHPQVKHPLVQTDAFSGRRYLYGSREYMDSVEGFDHNENEAFFTAVDELLQDEDHVYIHRWTPNDLVLWKTRTTYHKVTEVEPGVDRTVYRISIQFGD